MSYTKKNSRVDVKFIDADTEKTLFEIKDRTWLTVGEIFSNGVATALIEQEFKNKKCPKNVMVIAVGEFELVEYLKLG